MKKKKNKEDNLSDTRIINDIHEFMRLKFLGVENIEYQEKEVEIQPQQNKMKIKRMAGNVAVIAEPPYKGGAVCKRCGTELRGNIRPEYVEFCHLCLMGNKIDGGEDKNGEEKHNATEAVSIQRYDRGKRFNRRSGGVKSNDVKVKRGRMPIHKNRKKDNVCRTRSDRVATGKFGGTKKVEKRRLVS